MTEPVGLPACYRHPDRVTGIRCTRCERPICPECMIAAPVGFQCPDCVALASRQVRQPTTVAGATLIARPVVTYSLIGITAAIYLAQMAIGVNAVAGDYGMWPVGIAVNGEWWRLVSAAFLHGSFLHIAFNMYVLFALGPTLERILGHGRYLALYLLAALGGGVASYVFSDLRTVSVGASGAIFGLMGALVVAGRRLKYDITQVLVLLGINVVIGFLAPGVDWRAHLGGLVTGAAVAAIMVFAPARHRTVVQVGGVLALLVVMGALTMWRTAQIQDYLAPLGIVGT
ncbi:MAG: rhomboid family intramembrane serine protease [Actinomycetota bacterium]|nr:rhomboid family intramembrane serine protease [Actinomycetota bacterium]